MCNVITLQGVDEENFYAPFYYDLQVIECQPAKTKQR